MIKTINHVLCVNMNYIEPAEMLYYKYILFFKCAFLLILNTFILLLTCSKLVLTIVLPFFTYT